MQAISPQKQCGGCTLCCKVMAITELQKPESVWCRHCLPGKGCEIYGAKPDECTTFACGWLMDDRLGPEWRPDKSKIVLFYEQQDNKVVGRIDGNSLIWRSDPYRTALRGLAAGAIPHGGTVMIVQQRRSILITPDGEIDLGVLGDSDRVVTAIKRRPDGTYQFDAKVVKA